MLSSRAYVYLCGNIIRMEKRIRVIWILSLASAALLIIMQGYWLYNQYGYVVDACSSELADKILQAGEEEYRIRKDEKVSPYSFILNRSSEYKKEEGRESQSHEVFVGISKSGTPLPADKADATTILDSVERKQLKQLRIGLDQLEQYPTDSTETPVRLSFSATLPADLMHAAIDRTITHMSNPFHVALLDSILTADLPDTRLTLYPSAKGDSSVFTSGWEKTGNLLYPAITVNYAYSPMQYQYVTIHADIPAQPLFRRMAVQLALSLLLIFLLTGCLVYQIKTILKQQKITELRQNFVNTMIHELRRPVQTLKTFVSYLGDKEMRADETLTQQVVQDSLFELDNLSAYLAKLRDMVRADDEVTLLKRTKFNLRELVEKVIRLTTVPAGKDVSFATSFEMETPVIEADPVHVANILSNLIENAVKYSGEQVHITIRAERQGRELRLTVSDDGIGIPLAEQEKVFAKFYRGSNLPDRNLPGLGLGLSYVKLISEAHQGYVTLQSRLGEGTSITLCLPQ